MKGPQPTGKLSMSKAIRPERDSIMSQRRNLVAEEKKSFISRRNTAMQRRPNQVVND